MALSERSRTALYQGFSAIIDEEAVQEMLSFFPARDTEEPVTKEFLRAELSDTERRVDTRLNELESRVDTRMNELERSVDTRMNEFERSVDTRMNELELRLGSELRAEIRRTIWLNVGALTAFAAVIITAARV